MIGLIPISHTRINTTKVNQLYCESEGRNPTLASYKLNSLDYLYRPRNAHYVFRLGFLDTACSDKDN